MKSLEKSKQIYIFCDLDIQDIYGSYIIKEIEFLKIQNSCVILGNMKKPRTILNPFL